MTRHLRAHQADGGASAVEYALIVGAIAAVVIVVALLLGGVVAELFSDAKTCIEDHVPTSC